MQGMMAHQALGQQLVHQTPGGGAQMQGQWRQPLGGESTAPPPQDSRTPNTRYWVETLVLTLCLPPQVRS